MNSSRDLADALDRVYAVAKREGCNIIKGTGSCDWTIEGKLHAVLVHTKNGNHYLRPEYGQHGFVIIT